MDDIVQNAVNINFEDEFMQVQSAIGKEILKETITHGQYDAFEDVKTAFLVSYGCLQ